MTMKTALILTSVASMISQFNMSNIEILKKQGFKVYVASNFSLPGTIPISEAQILKKRLIDNQVVVFDIDIKRNPFSFSNIQAYRNIKKIFKKYNFDLVHSHSPIGGVLARLGAKKYRRYNTKSIYTAHGFHFFRGAAIKNWFIFYPIELFLSKYTDCLITINDEDFQLAQKKFFSDVVMLVNGVGVDTSKFKKVSLYEKNAIRKENNFSESDFLVVYVGELSDRKNQMMAITAVSRLKAEIPNIKLLLVGTGENRKKYELFIDKNNLGDSIKLLGYRQDIDKLMQMSDMAISCANQEGLPVNVMEAMATGLPLVVTNCRGNRDLVIDEKNGFIVERENSVELAEKIFALNRDSKMRMNFSSESFRLTEKYSILEINAQMEQIYKEIVNK